MIESYKRLRDGLIKIDDKAQTIYYEYGIGQKSLSCILGDKISSYESSREKPDPYYNPSSSDIKQNGINIAYTNGVIIESDSLLLHSYPKKMKLLML